ncbi:MAG TPA: RNA polymerase subunit sigma [Chloroflexi bacterium]|nr:RNA polymerase subunit sigma [Chloroflexota bacterium]
MLNTKLKTKLHQFAANNARVTILSGAGISAESGIPTFRGPEGYWTIGAREYFLEEMATQAMFRQQPDEVWRWYLYRRNVCRQAKPNKGHLALARLEAALEDRFTLITQNVDGLHLRAGNSLARTYQIHGNIDYMRCASECSAAVYPIPEAMPLKSKDDPLSDADRQLLRCPKCGSPTRPHVLWFDEYYNEDYYKFNSSLRVASQTDLLIVVGASGATNLPNQVGRLVQTRGGLIIDINPQSNPFSIVAAQSGGYFLQQSSGEALPKLVKLLVETVSGFRFDTSPNYSS